MNEREVLEAKHIEQGIAKWGESERKGLEEQARQMSLGTLRVIYAGSKGRMSTKIARHACEDGYS